MGISQLLKNARMCCAGLAIIMACATLNLAAQTAGSDRDAVLAANAGFYAALNQMFRGDAAPIEAVWSHAEDVVYMGPTGGYEHGWSAVVKDWEAQAALKLGGKVEPSEMQMIVGKDIAVVSDYEVGENTNADGKTQRVKLRATNIYRKEGGQWKMILHQTDKLPYLNMSK